MRRSWGGVVARWAGPVLCLAVVAAGCTQGETGGGPGEGLQGPDVPLSWSLDPVAEVGGASADGWAAFGEVTALGFDAEGRLYILDGRGGRVLVADPSGSLLRTVGAPGEGPGELRFPRSMAVHPDGAVSIFDPGHRGFVVFGPDGGYLRIAPVDPAAFPAPEGPLYLTGTEGIVTPTLSPGGPEGGVEREGYRPVVVYDDGPAAAHRVLHRGWDPPVPETREPGPEVTGGFRVRLPPVVAFHPGLLVAPAPGGGIAVADTVTWRVRLLDDEGAEVMRLERPEAPHPVTERIREAERVLRLEAALENLPRMVLNRSGGASAAVPSDAVRRLEEARISGMGFNPVVPVLEGLLPDPGGRLWVRRTGAMPGEPGPMDVVGADGQYLGTVAPGVIPAGAVFGPGGLVAAAGTDSLGAPQVRIFRLVTSE